MNTPNFHELKYNNLRIVLAYIANVHGDTFYVCGLENGNWIVDTSRMQFNDAAHNGEGYAKETIEAFGWGKYMVEENIVYSHKIKQATRDICKCDIVTMWNYGHVIGCVERKG
ncbi:MAG: hypothetical protein UT24_C0037G0018 [Candidatus Woesebacteria bacterium GW2011_GWB1_39_12]|uniref:Uncharacterized protein n=1 Tax=Candidatus Woesebacteria bacterium GW2011_GWB1_39_12 TaxID=1618574 RepID=A0A0G0PKP2_9BACT|nr:MAG: hypothetical protein UT24_C0037G0018 [Candidatus Woesebacteria bacterium GW2011_GWB1_39_12]